MLAERILSCLLVVVWGKVQKTSSQRLPKKSRFLMFRTWVPECLLASNHEKSCPGSVCLLGGFVMIIFFNLPNVVKLSLKSEIITWYRDDDLKKGWWSTEDEPLYLRSGLCPCSPQGAHGPQVNGSCLLCRASGLVWGLRAGLWGQCSCCCLCGIFLLIIWFSTDKTCRYHVYIFPTGTAG